MSCRKIAVILFLLTMCAAAENPIAQRDDRAAAAAFEALVPALCNPAKMISERFDHLRETEGVAGGLSLHISTQGQTRRRRMPGKRKSPVFSSQSSL